MNRSRPQPRARHTRIVATIGPGSRSPQMLQDLLECGVDVARINCSHASHDVIRADVARIRRAAMQANRNVAILLDLQGPKIRTSKIPEPLDLPEGACLTVVMDPDVVGEGHRCGTTWPTMADDVKAGELVLFADGALGGTVEAIRRPEGAPAEVDIRMTIGGKLGSHKGINLPQTHIQAPALTAKDRADLKVGVAAGVDYVALSFVRHAQDCIELRSMLDALEAPDMPVIAKIEKPEAVAGIDAILEHVQGLMVARGDLGVEIPYEQVPSAQKCLIQAANRAGALVITATQMLDSMERNPRPTRAEITDVANAILDGTDAVMLSGETSIGDYPVLAVRMMDKIAREVEGSRFFTPTPLDEMVWLEGSSGLVVRSACWAASQRQCPLVVFSWSGQTAREASKTRPLGPIYALTSNAQTADRLSLAWGVTPLVVPPVDSVDEMVNIGARSLVDTGLVEEGEELVILAGPSPVAETANLFKLHVAGR